MKKDPVKITIIGGGNLGTAIAEGVVKAGLTQPGHVVVSRRHLEKIEHLRELGFTLTSDNRQAVQEASLIFLCVQPKQLSGVLDEIVPHLVLKKNVLVSTITGVTIDEIARKVGKPFPIIRAMPNTAVAIGNSMTCICAKDVTGEQLKSVQTLFDALGKTLVIEERLMKAATVLAASGIAFFMRYIRAVTQAGIQLGFDAEEAQLIAVQTAKGGATLLLDHHSHPEVEIDKVTTPEGCTIEGLNEMEHQGMSSALIKGIVTSYEKISKIKE